MPSDHRNGAARRYFFLVHNRNHVRLFAPPASALRRWGHRCTFVDVERIHAREGATQALARRALASIPWDEAQERLRPGDVLAVANDWAPPELIHYLERRRPPGVLAVGYLEGCRFASPPRYRRVDRLLAWGPSAAGQFRVPVEVVGNPVIEAAWQPRPRFEEPAFAVVNCKFTYEALAEGYDDWMGAVTGACRAVGIDPRVSHHPANSVGGPPGSPGADIRALIRGGSLLVTRPSTVVYEAMAAGKPVVLFPTPGEDLGEFAQPMGAFGIARSPCDLPRLVRRALADRHAYRDRCRAFFEHHVSFTRREPSWARIARALRALETR